MPELHGTTIDTTIDRVVDGDTVAVAINNRPEKLRLSHLDTEESNHGSDKPVTPWGKEAKQKAIRLLPPGTPVTLEFAGTEPQEICLERYRDNFGRLLVWLYQDDQDFQQAMILEGYSPYFSKYGYADFPSHHARYLAAERAAQAAHIGVWDQVGVNGSEQRNYALLGVWWTLRAELIDDYRRLRAARPELLNSRRDYAKLHELAAGEQTATVFTELRTYTPVGQNKAIVDIGSKAQPFKLFLPDIDSDAGQEILRLLDDRYIPKDPDHVRRSYAYVDGPLKLFRDEPEVVVSASDQITDVPA
jgi:endonuclease YncB( thermonuclease family)